MTFEHTEHNLALNYAYLHRHPYSLIYSDGRRVTVNSRFLPSEHKIL